MSSGQLVSWFDLWVECDGWKDEAEEVRCEYKGWVEEWRDIETYRAGWTCPWCRTERTVDL